METEQKEIFLRENIVMGTLLGLTVNSMFTVSVYIIDCF